VGEAVSDEAKLAFLDILLDRVEGLLLGDLIGRYVSAWQIKHDIVTSRYGEHRQELTSSLALVHLGISTTMFRIVCCSLA
jgi:hypothetical protein